MNKKENRGGKRVAGDGKKLGRPPKPPTKVFYRSVPLEHFEEIKERLDAIISEYSEKRHGKEN